MSLKNGTPPGPRDSSRRPPGSADSLPAVAFSPSATFTDQVAKAGSPSASQFSQIGARDSSRRPIPAPQTTDFPFSMPCTPCLPCAPPYPSAPLGGLRSFAFLLFPNQKSKIGNPPIPVPIPGDKIRPKNRPKNPHFRIYCRLLNHSLPSHHRHFLPQIHTRKMLQFPEKQQFATRKCHPHLTSHLPLGTRFQLFGKFSCSDAPGAVSSLRNL